MGTRLLVIAMALLLVSAACSSDDEPLASELIPDPTATPSEPVEEPTSTPEPEPTATEAPTAEPTAEPEPTVEAEPDATVGEAPVSQWTAEEEAVILSGHVFWDLIIRSNNPGARADDPAYFLFVTGAARDLMIDVTLRTSANDQSTRGEVLMQPTSVTIDGDDAVLVECVLDGVDTLDAAGAVIEPADTAPTVWQTTLQWSGDVWQTELFTRLDGTCDLDESLATVAPFPALN